jgi:hypothetical protein
VTTTPIAYLAFRRDLRLALRQASADALRAVLWRWTELRAPTLRYLLGLPDEALELVARRLILADPRLADLHEAARRWLAERGEESAGVGPVFSL